jgi:hypothetical protein
MWPGSRTELEQSVPAERKRVGALAQSRQPRSLNTWRARWRTSPLGSCVLNKITTREKSGERDAFLSLWERQEGWMRRVVRSFTSVVWTQEET